MSKPRVAINGFGRIGRIAFRANLASNLLDIVAINDPGDLEQHLVLLKYDSCYGVLDAEILIKNGNLVVNGKEIKYTQIRNPEELPWAEQKIDLVLECTGVFTDKAGAGKHITAGAKRVLISAPSKDADVTLCMGINQETFDPAKHTVISNASCTTNCLAPLVKVLNEEFGIVKGFMTTIHSYTGDQRLNDATHDKDVRRARAANLSMIPTSTGAAKAIGEVIPEVEGKLDGVAIRVPTPVVSLTDLVVEVSRETSAEEVNAAFVRAAAGSLKGILQISNEPLVSVDFKGNNHSSILDAELTNVKGNMVKLMSWYDNEWGYSVRLVEMAKMIGEK